MFLVVSLQIDIYSGLETVQILNLIKPYPLFSARESGSSKGVDGSYAHSPKEETINSVFESDSFLNAEGGFP